MASHVVVIDSIARRAIIKTTPGKHLSDVLQEACTKLGLQAHQYGLRNNNKPVDLSRNIRLSGLSSGAKLELVQLSRSAAVVSVALQLPESEAEGAPNSRLTDKFPSTTTLWLILRKFEAGVAGGGGVKRNLTARGAPGVNNGSNGSGRLYFQTPVIQVMGRELSSFTDLQKTLAQLGFNGGSTLLRLSFRTSETPLEEAMVQIDEYFKSVEEPTPDRILAVGSEPKAAEPALSATQPESLLEVAEAPSQSPSGVLSPLQTTIAPIQGSNTPSLDTPLTTTTSGRPLEIFRAPTSSTPSAALTTYNPNDYIPSIEHAQRHQQHLAASTRPNRLPTDAELAAQAAAEQEKLHAVKGVEIKIRFPDETAVSAPFKQEDTGKSLYEFVRECLDTRWQAEAFLLKNPGQRGKAEIVPDDAGRRLIRDLGLKGRVLVVFSWDEKNSSVMTQGQKHVLRQDLRAKAKDLKVKEVKGEDDEGEGQGIKVQLGRGGNEQDKGKKKGGMPAWLNKLSKK